MIARAALLAGVVLLACPAAAVAQVFLASTPSSGLTVGPLFISALRSLAPRQSTYEDVVRLCGLPTEERQWGPSAHRRTMLYRGTRTVTHPRWALGWFTAVRHRDVEHHEVMIDLEDDRVREVDTVIRRVRDG